MKKTVAIKVLSGGIAHVDPAFVEGLVQVEWGSRVAMASGTTYDTSESFDSILERINA